MRPASDYIREFTRNVPRAKVLSVRAVMWPALGSTPPAARVRDSDKIEGVEGEPGRAPAGSGPTR
jgi:glycine betaine/proline transport system ATP-binding protein